MRRAARIDATQTAIIAALRKIGCRVLPTHTLGSGAPDLIVARGRTLRFLECKDGAKPPSARKLTPLEAKFYDEWHPHVVIVESVDDALTAMGTA